MNHAKRSVALQTRITALRAERKRIDTDLRRLLAELRRITPRKPRTGATAMILDALRMADCPLTSRQVADAIPQFEAQRVQMLLNQLSRRGVVSREAVKPTRRGPYSPGFLFSIERAA